MISDFLNKTCLRNTGSYFIQFSMVINIFHFSVLSTDLLKMRMSNIVVTFFGFGKKTLDRCAVTRLT